MSGPVNVDRDEARWWVDEQIRRWIAEGVSVDLGRSCSWWQVREDMSGWLVLNATTDFDDARVTIRRRHRRDAAE
jgi:hypothetical protein